MTRKTILTALLGLSLLSVSSCTLPGAAPSLPTLVPTSLILPGPTLPPASPVFVTPLVPLQTQAIATLPSAVVVLGTPLVTSAPPSSPTAVVGGVTPVPAAAFCADSQPATVINSLKTALQTQDGVLLASLVSPVHGMDVRYYREARVVTYDRTHAKFLFESTFQVNWGDAPGSGLPTVGSFHEVVLPALLKVFDQTYTPACNQLQVGGTTYTGVWAYPSINYYSLYYPGTAENGNMDWHTWAIGMEYVNGKPYVYALMQFEWEP